MNRAISKFVRSGVGSKDTVIVLLGWGGAKDVLLNKYVNLYHQRGYDTVQFIANLKSIPGGEPVKDSREVSSLAENMKSVMKDKKVAIHCFSMNGVFTICSLHLQYPELNLLKNTEGIIFDSAPVTLGFDSIGTFMEVLDYTYADKIANFTRAEHLWFKFYKLGQGLTMAKHHALLATLWALGMDQSKYNTYDFLKAHPDLPQVLSFVYSDADYICPVKYIAPFAKYQRKRGRDVEELHLKESDHVQHLRMYPEQYERLIDNFLAKIRGRSKL